MLLKGHCHRAFLVLFLVLSEGSNGPRGAALGSESRGPRAPVPPIRLLRLPPSTPTRGGEYRDGAGRQDSAPVLQWEQRRKRCTPRSLSSVIISLCLNLLMLPSKPHVSPCHPQEVFVSQECRPPKSIRAVLHSGHPLWSAGPSSPPPPHGSPTSHSPFPGPATLP